MLAVIAGALGAGSLAAPTLANIGTDTASTNDGTVTMIVALDYTQGQCTNGNTSYRVNSVTTKFNRAAGSGRRVSVSHLLALGFGHKCNGDIASQQKQGKWAPKFGCGGRCPGTTTAQLGISVKFAAIQADGLDPSAVGGSGDGHATTSGGAALSPNPICQDVWKAGSSGQIPCPDNF